MEKRAAGYDMPFLRVNGMDLEAVYFAAEEAIAYARSGNGPFLIQADTYRYEGHYYGDPMVYRTKEEIDSYREKDPIGYAEGLLFKRGIMKQDAITELRNSIQAEVDEAVAFAEASPQPTLESMFEDVYTEWQS